MDNEIAQSARKLVLDPSPENTIRHFLLLSRHGIININNVFPGILNAGQEAADYQSSYNQWSGTSSSMAQFLADKGRELSEIVLNSLKKAGFEYEIEEDEEEEDEEEEEEDEIDEGDEEELLGDMLGEWDT